MSIPKIKEITNMKTLKKTVSVLSGENMFTTGMTENIGTKKRKNTVSKMM